MNYDLINKLNDMKKVFPLLVFYSWKITTMSPSTKLNLVKNAHLKSQNAIELK